jgi:DNA-binding MarR family transcriptional regulator
MRRALSDLHMLILQWIGEHPDYTVDDLVRVFGFDRERTEEICDDLAAAGYITPIKGTTH